jgi:hypothetical protein
VSLKVIIRVFAQLPDGRLFLNTPIKCWSNLGFRGRSVVVRTDTDGVGRFHVTFPLASPLRIVRTNVSAQAIAHDDHGVSWSGQASRAEALRPSAPECNGSDLVVPMQRGKTDISHLRLDPAVVGQLRINELGHLVLDDILELFDALRASMPVASLTLCGKILDGFLRFRGELEGWWTAALVDLPLGALIQTKEVKGAIGAHLPAGEVDRLRGSSVWTRNVAAHQKYAPVTIQDALASAGIVLRAVERWQ